MTPARRLRIIGAVVLIVGLAGAGLFYRIASQSAGPTMDDLMPGYSEHRARQNAIQMGELVVTLLAMADAMKEPRAQALLIAGVSGLVAAGCFRVASVMDRRDEHV